MLDAQYINGCLIPQERRLAGVELGQAFRGHSPVPVRILRPNLTPFAHTKLFLSVAALQHCNTSGGSESFHGTEPTTQPCCGRSIAAANLCRTCNLNWAESRWCNVVMTQRTKRSRIPRPDQIAPGVRPLPAYSPSTSNLAQYGVMATAHRTAADSGIGSTSSRDPRGLRSPSQEYECNPRHPKLALH